MVTVEGETMQFRIAIHGAAGRMGQRLVACAGADPEIELVAAIDSADSPKLGQDSGMVAGIGPNQVPITAKWNGRCDAVIDFSSPAGAKAALQMCLDVRLPLVLATTGLTPEFLEELQTAAHEIPILTAPNMSTSVNLAIHLAQVAARVMKQAGMDTDVEIVERHHRMKHDSPSGTALRFGEVIAKELKLTEAVHGRQGMVGPRPMNEIGYHAVRTGDDAGQHLVIFGMLGETLEIRIAATNRDGYARGALSAAKFLCSCGPGMYSMSDVLGF
jgi:4-hydroxy-tetrahydrodipicolinate reductase